jgi:hypothetical protein
MGWHFHASPRSFNGLVELGRRDGVDIHIPSAEIL